MDVKQLYDYVISPTLDAMGPPFNSKAAKLLLLGTAGVETNFGHYIHQMNGPATSIYQIEPATYKWLCEKYKLLEDNDSINGLSFQSLTYNLQNATLLARMCYYAIPFPIPSEKIEDLAKYWKEYYNTNLGKGTVSKFIQINKKAFDLVK